MLLTNVLYFFGFGQLVLATSPDFHSTSDELKMSDAYYSHYYIIDGEYKLEGSCRGKLYANQDKQLCDFHSSDVQEGIENDPVCINTTLAYLSHPLDCQRVIKCLSNITYELICPPGFHFDKNEAKCRDARFVTCSPDPRCTGGVDFLQHPSDCRKFVQCYGNASYIRECLSNTWFNPTEKKCTEPESSGCVVTEPRWKHKNVCDGVRDEEIKFKQCSCGCNFYWKCIGKEQNLEKCPEGLVFHSEKQMCLSTSPCENYSRKPFQWTTPPSILPSAYLHPLCIRSDDDYKYLRHPTDCTKFLECISMYAHERSCPNGLYFNYRKKTCVPPASSGCRNLYWAENVY